MQCPYKAGLYGLFNYTLNDAFRLPFPKLYVCLSIKVSTRLPGAKRYTLLGIGTAFISLES